MPACIEYGRPCWCSSENGNLAAITQFSSCIYRAEHFILLVGGTFCFRFHFITLLLWFGFSLSVGKQLRYLAFEMNVALINYCIGSIWMNCEKILSHLLVDGKCPKISDFSECVRNFSMLLRIFTAIVTTPNNSEYFDAEFRTISEYTYTNIRNSILIRE